VKKFRKAKEIKVGVVGYGGAFNMGKQHLELMQDAGMSPCAVCEIDAERLKVAEKEFPGIATYTKLEAMLRGVKLDLAVLITPHNLHAKQAIACLNAGVSVVCEKPFAITTKECDAMIAAAKRNKLVLSTYHNRHWDGGILAAMKVLKSGRIGEVYKIEANMGGWGKPRDWWRSSKSISGGILYDWGVHLLEYSLQILGDAKLVEVAGFAKQGHWAPQSKWGKDTNEDEGWLVARFDGGQWVKLCISSLDVNPKPHWLDISGTKGSILLSPGGCKTIWKDGETTLSEDQANCSGDYKQYYRNVADHMVKGTPLVITPEWSRRPIHIIDLACQSAAKGRALPAKYS